MSVSPKLSGEISTLRSAASTTAWAFARLFKARSHSPAAKQTVPASTPERNTDFVVSTSSKSRIALDSCPPWKAFSAAAMRSGYEAQLASRTASAKRPRTLALAEDAVGETVPGIEDGIDQVVGDMRSGRDASFARNGGRPRLCKTEAG